MPNTVKELKKPKMDLKKKPEKEVLIGLGKLLDYQHPFNKLQSKKKKDIEKIFIKKNLNRIYKLKNE